MQEPDFAQQLDAALSTVDGLQAALAVTLEHLSADTGTVHTLGKDGLLHLATSSGGIPEPVLTIIGTIPVGKGMAGLAVERREPVTACNIQTDDSGDVRPKAKDTGLQGAIVVPMMRDGAAIGALGIANRAERTFTAAETETLLVIGRTMAAKL